jgi:hypothetical protein
MREVGCGAPLWSRPSPSLVFPHRGLVMDSTRALRRARLRRPGIRLRQGRHKAGHRIRAVQPHRIRAVRLPSTRADRPHKSRAVRLPTMQRLAPDIRRLPIAATQAHPMRARLVLVMATPARPLRGTWATGSISIAECRCRTRSGCFATTPTSTGFLPATSSGWCSSCTR